MRLPDLLFRSRRRSTSERRALTTLPWWDRGLDGIPTNTYSGTNVDQKIAMTFSAVYASVTLIADAVASLPAEALNGDENIELPQWIRSPNREIRRFDFWNQIMVSVLLWGNGYAQFINRPSDGVPIGLVPLDPATVHVEWNPNVPGERRYKIGHNGPWLSRREIFHIQGPTLPGAAKGMSVIAQAREAVALGLTLEEFGARYFAQGSQAKVVIEMPPSANVDAEKAKQIVKIFEKFHRGKGNWHRPAIMSGGAKLHNIQIPPEDAQFLQSREFQAIEIARWFRVPPHRIGIVSKQSSWGSGLAEENTAMVQHTFKPWILRVEEALSAYAPGPEGLGVRIRLVDSGLLRGTAKEQADLHIALYQAQLITKNEARVPLGYPKVDGGDEFLETPQPQAAPIGKSEPSEANQPGSRTPDKRSEVDPTEAEVARLREIMESRHPGHSPQKVHAGGKSKKKLPEGKPELVSSAEFDKQFPDSDGRWYRGTKSEAGAQATMDGELGDGDFGKGVYLGSLGIAQSYMQSYQGDREGRMLRIGIRSDAKVKSPPSKVKYGSSAKLDKWAAENEVDVLDLDSMMLVKNPAAMVIDKHKYTVEESVVLDYTSKGYELPEKYKETAKKMGRSARTSERRFSAVTREVSRIGDNCPQCQVNTDPANVPVHPGCNCDAITTEVETGLPEGSVPTLAGVAADVNTAAALPISDLRFGDLVRWAEQVAGDLGDAEAITLARSEEDETMYALVSAVTEDQFEPGAASEFVTKVYKGVRFGFLRPGSAAGMKELFDDLMGGA